MLDYISGVSTSDILTGQQWDFPNAWPPLQDLVITALENSELKESRELAFNLTTKWITSNLVGYQKYGAMFEKVGNVVHTCIIENTSAFVFPSQF